MPPLRQGLIPLPLLLALAMPSAVIVAMPLAVVVAVAGALVVALQQSRLHHVSESLAAGRLHPPLIVQQPQTLHQDAHVQILVCTRLVCRPRLAQDSGGWGLHGPCSSRGATMEGEARGLMLFLVGWTDNGRGW